MRHHLPDSKKSTVLSGRERRRDPRHEINFLVRVEIGGVGQFYRTKSLSSGGVFLLADKPLAEETPVQLELFLPRTDRPLNATGEVVWNQRQEPAGFAVKFTGISAMGRHTLQQYLPQPAGA
jgi:uncharacterized protein (TIGR02266 family)